MIFFRVFIVFSFIILFSPSMNPYNNETKRINVKIVIVNSYNYANPCTRPQVNGFRYYLSQYDRIFNFSIVSFDMKTKIFNISKENIRSVAKKIITQIKNIKPDIIYTTDDNAFQYVGIPLSKYFPVFASGLNDDIENYIKKFNLDSNINNIVFISEYIKLNKLWKFLDNNRIIINNIYIISEKSNTSITCYYLLKTYLRELKKYNLNITIFRVSNEVQLKSILNELNNKEDGIIIPILQRLKMEDGRIVDLNEILKIIIKYNKKHIEFLLNGSLCKLGFAVCLSPSFYDMGEKAASNVIDYLYKKYIDKENKFENFKIIYPENKLYVNKERCRQLGYNINENDEYIDRVYIKIYKNKMRY